MSQESDFIAEKVKGAEQSGIIMLDGTIELDTLKSLFRAVENISPIKYLRITHGMESKEKSEELSQFLNKHSDLRQLHLEGCKIGDEGIAILAPVIAQHPSLSHLTLMRCGITAQGMDAFFDEGAATQNLINLTMYQPDNPYGRDPIGEEANQAFHKRMADYQGKNLVSSSPGIGYDVTNRNRDAGNALLWDYPEGGAKDLSGAQLRGIHERESYVFDEDNRSVYRGDSADKTQEAKAEYVQLIYALPSFPATGGIDALLTPNETGFAPLDNPRVWNGKTLEDFAAIPLTQENLNSHTPKGSSLLDSAFAAFSAEELIPHLNSRGIQLQETYLLDKEGKPTEILERIIDDGKPAALFTPENWMGASRQQILRVHQALPEEQKSRVPLHRLQAAVESAITRQGVGR